VRATVLCRAVPRRASISTCKQQGPPLCQASKQGPPTTPPLLCLRRTLRQVGKWATLLASGVWHMEAGFRHFVYSRRVYIFSYIIVVSLNDPLAPPLPTTITSRGRIAPTTRIGSHPTTAPRSEQGMSCCGCSHRSLRWPAEQVGEHHTERREGEQREEIWR
jgi:hypothetical protein